MSKIRRFVLVLFLFAGRLCFAQSAIPTFSNEQLKAHGKVDVLIIVSAYSGEENNAVKDILSQSIRIEVENAGFKAQTRSLSRERVRDFFKDSDKLNAGLLRISQRSKADFTIFCMYNLNKYKLKLEFSLFDTEQRSIINRKSADIRLDLSSDIFISFTIEELIKESEQRIQYVAEGKPVNPGGPNASVSAKTERTSAAASTGGEGISPAGTSAAETKTSGVKSAPSRQGQKAVQIPENEGKIIKGGGVVITLPKKYKHLDFGLGFAPFIPIGELGSYLTVAYNPYASFSYRVFVPFGIISAGFRIGSGIGYASGIAEKGILSLSPVGINISYSTFRMTFLSLFLRAAGGMAVIAFFPEGGTISGAAVPYAEAGAGFSVFFTNSLKLSAETAYSVFFNSDPLIMGLIPSLMLSLLL